MSLITQEIAEAVVHEIGSEMDYHINLMDEHAVIIASTDRKRIGMKHEGALRILREGIEELPIEEDDATETTRIGTNLAIHYQKSIVGGIGITGPREEVQQFGKIVRRMTEVLLEESLRQSTGILNRRIVYRFVDEWLRTEEVLNNASLVERGKALGMDVRLPRRCFVIRYQQAEELNRTLEGQRTMGKMDRFIRTQLKGSKDTVYYHQATDQYCFVPAVSDDLLLERIHLWQRQIRHLFHQELFVAYDSDEKGTLRIQDAFQEAEQALACCTLDRPILGYGELSLELVLNEVSAVQAGNYLYKLFRTKDTQKWREWMILIALYFQYGGAITKMAEESYIHKNTLQYRLKKLALQTGMDIRRPTGAAHFYIAKELYTKYFH